MSDKIFDFYLYLSSDDEVPNNDAHMKLNDTSNIELTVNDATNILNMIDMTSNNENYYVSAGNKPQNSQSENKTFSKNNKVRIDPDDQN